MSTSYTNPLYKASLYQEKAFGASWVVEKLGQKVDYSNVCCPVAEKLAVEERITVGHHYNLMGEKKDIDGLVDAIIKIQQNVEEIL